MDLKAKERLEALGAVMEEAQGQVYASCAMTLREPLPEAAVVAAAMCQGAQEPLSARQELEALRLLQRFVPKAAEEVQLPSKEEWRKYCAAVVNGFGPRLQVAEI